MTDHKKEMSEDKNQEQEYDQKYEERREFLRKSLYAAYATPLIVSLLVNKANAAQSWDPKHGKLPGRGQPPWGCPPPPWQGPNG